MNSILENVSTIAVWGSLGASFFLGAFLVVQAVLDEMRRYRYALLAVGCALTATVDFLHPYLELLVYEQARIFSWSFFSGSLLWFLLHSRRLACLGAIVPLLAGLAAWHFWKPEVATTFVVPTAFAFAAIAHGYQFSRFPGFASCVLSVLSFTLSMLCYSYYLFLSTGDVQLVSLGYVHYALLSILLVIFGWTNLPRELSGKYPVKIPNRHACWYASIIIVSEAVLLFNLLYNFSWPPTLYIFVNLIQVASTLTLFFYNRHQLVVHTDNVAELLETRTESLRRAQQELARQNEFQAQQLEEQARELEAKAGVIQRQRRLELAAQTTGQAAHDIQNLITPMLNQIHKIKTGVQHDSKSNRALSLLGLQLNDLLHLNAQMLALSRRGRVEQEPVPLVELVGDIVQRFPEGQIELQVKNPSWVAGSWSQLSRALSNLILNAFESYSDNHASREQIVIVTISEERIETLTRCHLGFLHPGRYSTVSVQDTGGGIPSEILEQIFEPFFSSKGGKESSGSGLGLAIVAAVVDDHGGVLDLVTGKAGTTFTLYFPLISPQLQERTTASLIGNETVLLVDDDLGILEQYSSFLTEAGYEVIGASNGREALRVLQLEQVDLMLLDLNMPEMNGYDTLFGALHLRPGTKTVIHSAFLTERERSQLQLIGARAFLQKPAGKVEVLSTLRSVIDS